MLTWPDSGFAWMAEGLEKHGHAVAVADDHNGAAPVPRAHRLQCGVDLIGLRRTADGRWSDSQRLGQRFRSLRCALSLAGVDGRNTDIREDTGKDPCPLLTDVGQQTVRRFVSTRSACRSTRIACCP